ncbi:MAG TPA: N-acetylneuraminate synthase [Candidatus Ozemobacteraceae bacterium]|nr:N-acetylneuraminate synthase [Candidatus Ozemobacteraceae bacterium]
MTEQIQRTLIIAEAGVNHNGSPDLALQLVEIAAKAGADIVKFQTFKAERVISRFAPKAEYQTRTTDIQESQLEMVRKLELDEDTHRRLINRCGELGIEFLSTPFDEGSVDLLVGLKVKRIKIPSGEITNGPLLLKIARTGFPVILSTGMATLHEIEEALGVLAFGYTNRRESPSRDLFKDALATGAGQAYLAAKVTLMHCTTEYPAPFEDVNLRAMDTMRETYGLPVGLSDHTTGIAVSLAAVARGATTIEKHFTLDRTFPGPDHKASLEPLELTALVTGIRQIESALGSGFKQPAPSERKNIAIARKSLVAAVPLKAGDPFTPENLTAKRPGSGISPMDYWASLGHRAHRDYDVDEPIGTL